MLERSDLRPRGATFGAPPSGSVRARPASHAFCQKRLPWLWCLFLQLPVLPLVLLTSASAPHPAHRRLPLRRPAHPAGVCPNGMRALEAISPQLKQELMQHHCEYEQRVMYDK